MSKLFGSKFEKAIHLLCRYMPQADELIKPTLFHSIRVGVYLYDHNYDENIVLAGVLHDSIEDTDIDEHLLQSEFNEEIANIVKANSKDKSISDSDKRIEELIKRCISSGQNALIVKAADVLDNYKYYAKTNSKDGLKYCANNAKTIFQYIPNNFDDNIFDELKNIHEEYRT